MREDQLHGWNLYIGGDYQGFIPAPPRRVRLWRFLRHHRVSLYYVIAALAVAVEVVLYFIPATHTLGWALLRATAYALSRGHAHD